MKILIFVVQILQSMRNWTHLGHTPWQWVTNKSGNKRPVLTGMPIVCLPARGSLRSLALDRVMWCFIGQFTNSYEEMGGTPRIPRVGESEFFLKKFAFLEPVSEQNGYNFCRLSDSPQGQAVPLLRVGSLVSVHVCAHTHKHTQSEQTLPPVDISAPQLLHLRLREHCERGTTKIAIRVWLPESLLWSSLFCKNESWTTAISMDKQMWKGDDCTGSHP